MFHNEISETRTRYSLHHLAIAALLQQGSKAVEGPELELAGSASPHVVRYSATARPILLAARTLRSTIDLLLQPHRAAPV